MDRLGWTAGFSVAPFRLRIGVRTNDPDIVGRLRAMLVPSGWRVRTQGDPKCDLMLSLRVGPPTGARGRRNYHLVYWSSTSVARTLNLEEALGALERYFHRSAAVSAPDRTLLRAGVLAWRGRALVVAGEPGGGQTTLVKALAEQGAALYSDRFALLDDAARVAPYPAPLRLGEDGGTRFLAPRSLGWKASHGPLPVGAVVLTHYREGSRFRPARISPCEAVQRLLAGSERGLQAQDLERVTRAVEPGPCWRGPRGEAAEAARTLLGRLDW